MLGKGTDWVNDTVILQVIIQQESEKLTKISARELDFKDIKFPVKVRHIHKIQKGIVSALLFLVMKIAKKYPVYVSKNTFKRHVELLLIGEESKRHYVLNENFNTFMCYHKLHRGRKNPSRYFLQPFS